MTHPAKALTPLDTIIAHHQKMEADYRREADRALTIADEGLSDRAYAQWTQTWQISRDTVSWLQAQSARIAALEAEVERLTKERDEALVKRLDTRHKYRIEEFGPAGIAAYGAPFWATVGLPDEQEDAVGPSAPIVILIALLRALQSKEGQHG